jgi:predicted nucleic acid-binding protein
LTLADSSAWVEYLRRSESEIDLRVDRLIRERGIATTEPVAMELLAGARDDEDHGRLRRLLGRAELLPIAGFEDYEAAASIQRHCRVAEAPARNIVDCLIAAVAIRNGVALLHKDRDFDLIGRHTPLRIAA